MLLIFMSEYMFRSRDQSVKIQGEFLRYTSMALCFFYPHSVPIPHPVKHSRLYNKCFYFVQLLNGNVDAENR